MVMLRNRKETLLKPFDVYPKVCVKLRNLEKDLEYIWSRDKFVRRKYLMQEMYQNYTEGEDWVLPDVSCKLYFIGYWFTH